MAEERQDRPARRRISPRRLLWAAVALLVLVLILQNSHKVRVDVLFLDITARLWVLLLVAVLLGVLLGRLLPRLRRGRDTAEED